MSFILDRGEARLVADHVVALLRPDRTPEVPSTYGEIEPGDLSQWPSDSLELLIDQSRIHLDMVNSRFEQVRTRGQYFLGLNLAATGLSGAAAERAISGPITFVVWLVGMLALLAALLVSLAVVASTGRLGNVDAVLLSRATTTDPLELHRSVARAHTRAVAQSTDTFHVRFTLLRDAIWLLVVGVLLHVTAWLSTIV